MTIKQNLPLISLPSTGALGSIEAYVARVMQVPVLSAEDEQRLAHQWHYEENVEAAKQLVLSHLRFVVQIARGYMGYGLALPDLIQEGNIGLMKAVKRFDPKVGVRLISFAVHWIKSEIHDFVIRNWRIVRVATTKAQRKLFFNLRSTKKRLGWFTEEEINQVAQDLKVSASEVREMEMRLQAHDDSFDPEPSEESDNNIYVSPSEYLSDENSDPAVQLERWEENQRKEVALKSAWEALTPREQDIIQTRWLAEEKETLHEVAARYQVSAERVRQIEQGALRKLERFFPSKNPKLLSNALN